MVRFRSLVVLCAAFAVLVTACTGGSDTTASPVGPTTSAPSTTVATTAPPAVTSAPAPSTTAPTTSTTTTTAPPVDDGSLVGVPRFDPAACELGSEPAFGDYEITFVSDGFLLAADSEGTLRCIAPFENQDRIVWGPAADQLLTGTTRITPTEAHAGTIGEAAVFTRPTGRNMIWVQDDRLWKAAVDGSNIRDVSFLPRHVSVAYHPAGVEIATAGIDEQGRYGVWIARNDGTEAQRVVTAEEATISEVAFSESSGFFLSFIAEHEDGTRHLHELTLVDADGLAVRNEFDASIALESTRTLRGIVANPWTDEIAVTEGTCDDAAGPRVRLAWNDALTPGVADVPTEAIAWLPNGELLVAAYPDGCSGNRELWLVGAGIDASETNAVVVVRSAGPSAVRSPFPEPPKPLGEIDLDDFV